MADKKSLEMTPYLGKETVCQIADSCSLDECHLGMQTALYNGTSVAQGGRLRKRRGDQNASVVCFFQFYGEDLHKKNQLLLASCQCLKDV